MWVSPMFLALVLVTASMVDAHQITLRNLQLLGDVTVGDFDEDGVQLVGGRQLTWDQVMAGVVEPERQAAFDALRDRLSLPLYRLRWRLQLGDDSSLLSCSSPLLETYRNRQSETAALVWYAELRGRLAKGDRAAALTPLLALIRLSNTRQPNSPDRFSTETDRLQLGTPNPASGLYPELLPVWFDRAAAESEIDAVLEFYQQESAPSPVETFYVASLAIAADRRQVALELMSGIAQPTAGLKQWSQILELQLETPTRVNDETLKTVAAEIRTYPRDLQAVGYYCLGQARVASGQASTIQGGLLDLLRIPAEFNEVSDDLAGAALAQSATVLEATERPAEAERLWRELVTRHPQSWHARRRRGE